MLRSVSCVLVTLVLLGSGVAHGRTVSGPAEAIDGDTLSFSGTLVRLEGVDAVEHGQICLRDGAEWNCGDDARSRLGEFVRDTQVECTGEQSDAQGRLVARCLAGSLDLAEMMALSGFAVSLPEAAADYSEVEGRARRFGQGIWAAEFQTPSQWRGAHPEAAPKPIARAATAGKPKVYRDRYGCTIKGNWSYRGDFIYYLPGQPYYEQTRPEERFCTEEAAQAAGYRPSRAR